jgi:hypothetical protein
MTTGHSGLLGIDQGLVGRVVCACAMALTLPSCLQTIDRHDNSSASVRTLVSWPAGDPQSGKDLFVAKGCVICHSVNAVGGRAALPLDAPPDGRKIDPMVFAAAMWQGASAMLSLQLTELGYQIGISGDELRDLAAFASDLEIQTTFSKDEIPADIQSWIIDRPHWMDNDWPEPFETLPDDLTSPFEDL